MRNMVSNVITICIVGAMGVWGQPGILDKGEIIEEAPIESGQALPAIQEKAPDTATEATIILQNSSPKSDNSELKPEDFTVKSVPPEPTRPIGQTVAGAVCTGLGGITTISSVLLIVAMASTDAPEEVYIVPGVSLGIGLGLLIPGVTLLSVAQNKWQVHRKWEQKYKIMSGKPVWGLNYTFDY
jgi:hypothetical protein